MSAEERKKDQGKRGGKQDAKNRQKQEGKGKDEKSSKR